ncbi:hypothetical protein [Ruminococcus sp.]|uniref:hypothetical protein n=1 Tax=Ruminococcus sp. TaxID=41978 RepID=UPI0025F3715F|nr:hypothetical protein [Ruminococcus sp.]MCR4639551.1 hypothetical protein [Ruminococcus sp.]
MTERRFNLPLILLAVVSFGIGFFGFAAESILLAVGVIIASIKLREKYLIKIPVAICIIAIIASGALFAVLVWQEVKGIGSTDYWLMRLIFGEMK